MLKLIAPKNGAEISLSTKAQNAFRSRSETARRRAMDGELTFQWYALEKSNEKERSQPAPVTVKWQFEEDSDTPDDLRGGTFFVLVSEHKDFSDAVVTATDEMQADVWNLKIGTLYYFCVQHNGKRSEIRSFRTKATTPRCLRFEGVSNVRDIGGYTVDGQPIRQGLLFRGGEVERHMHLTETGIRRMQALGIKTDLDLRGESIGTVDYPLLPLYGIRRVLIPIGPYDSIFNEENRKDWQAIFRLLADESNYPVYHHCWGGADRGGTLAFLVGALLGMSEKDLDFDYEFTSLAIWGLRSQNFAPYILMKQKLFAYEGDTLAEKTATFLQQHFGITAEEIAAIRRIFL